MDWLFKPWVLGGMTLRNRLVMAPVKTAYGTPAGRVTERHLHFYRAVAEGGVGLAILEPVSVTQKAVNTPDSSRSTTHTASRNSPKSRWCSTNWAPRPAST